MRAIKFFCEVYLQTTTRSGLGRSCGNIFLEFLIANYMKPTFLKCKESLVTHSEGFPRIFRFGIHAYIHTYIQTYAYVISHIVKLCSTAQNALDLIYFLQKKFLFVILISLALPPPGGRYFFTIYLLYLHFIHTHIHMTCVCI